MFYRFCQKSYERSIFNPSFLKIFSQKTNAAIGKTRARNKAFGALLTDLFKVFNCLDHELLIGNLNAYGLILLPLRLIHNFLTHRKERARVNNSYSEWLAAMFGVP